MEELNIAMGNSFVFNDFEIVVARYNEDIDWTYQFENVYERCTECNV